MRLPLPLLLPIVLLPVVVSTDVISVGHAHNGSTPSTDYLGYQHNVAFPLWGTIDTQMHRQSGYAYRDGVYEPREGPNPRALSQRLFVDKSGRRSGLNRTALMTWFGQQLVEEVLDGQRSGCPVEYHNIPIPACDPLFDPTCDGDKVIPFRRSRYDLETGRGPGQPRNQINEITPWLDGNLFYGPGKAWTDAIRAHTGGRLASDDTGLYPSPNALGLPYANAHVPVDNTFKDARRFWRIGNPRGFENPALASLHVLWHREHNYQADRLAGLHPHWSDERIFNRARQWVIAIHQKIVFDEFVPAFTGLPLPPYAGHRNVHPGIAQEFQVAGMRFGHTLVPPGMWLRGAPTDNATCPFNVPSNYPGHSDRDTNTVSTLRTCNTYFNSVDILHHVGMESVLRGAASQLTELEDHHVTEDLRGFVFGPKELTRRDLMALNIQRAREHGVPGFNTVRVAYGLERYTVWENITTNATLVDALDDMYDSIEDVDLWVGGLLEGGVSGPGETFQAILINQFTRIRDGDMWYYANLPNGLFDHYEFLAINNTKFSDVLRRNGVGPVQDDVFFHTEGDVCAQPYQLDGDDRTHLNACSPPERYDWYEPSTGHFQTLLIGVGVWVVLSAASSWCARAPPSSPGASQPSPRAADNAVVDAGVPLPQGSDFSMVHTIAHHHTSSHRVNAAFAKRVATLSAAGVPPPRRKHVTSVMRDALLVAYGGNMELPRTSGISVTELAAVLREREHGSPLVAMLLKGVNLDDRAHSVSFNHLVTILRVLLTDDLDVRSEFVFSMLDTDLDDAVTFEEFQALVVHDARRHFNAIDTNGDGVISRDELRVYMEIGHTVFDYTVASYGFASRWRVNVRPCVDAPSPGADAKPVSADKAAFVRDPSWAVFLVVFAAANAIVVGERVYTYSVLRELRGLRQIAGYGISITRGAASGIMLNLSLLLFPLCKRLTAVLSTGWAGKLLPMGRMMEFHVIAGCTAGFWMVVHTIGHVSNFFHVSTQPAADIACLFPEVHFSSDYIPSFAWFWATATATGSTGVLLVIIFITFYVFSLRPVRDAAFRAFYAVHVWGSVLGFALSIVHGGAALVQAPAFLHYLFVPAVFLSVEFLLRVQFGYKPLEVVHVEALASGVTLVEVRKPDGYVYNAGQHVKLTLSPLGVLTSRTFTLTSAPHEAVLRAHIASRGPWTQALHKQARNQSSPLRTPHSRAFAMVSAPLGASFTTWEANEAIALVAGGIGVTAFASILATILNGWREAKHPRVAPTLRRVYLLWASRSQNQLEWFSDLLAELEREDHDGVLETHIFLTAPRDAFDLRLLAASALKDRMDGRGRAPGATLLPTPLHFGRPNLLEVCGQLQRLHPLAKVAVYTCGPPALAHAVEAACRLASSANPTTPLTHATETFY